MTTLHGKSGAARALGDGFQMVPRTVNLLRKHQSEKREVLHVITCVSNPNRYESRYRNAEIFIDHMVKTADVVLHVVEATFFGRPAEVCVPEGHHHYVLNFGREAEFFFKEGLINWCVRQLPHDATKFAWVDADVIFSRHNWAKETLLELDHYDVLQPWSNSVDLGPSGEVVENEHGHSVDRSFAYAYKHPLKGDWRQHYGYAWAMRLDTFDQIGGLIDWLVTGAADYFMSMGFGGKLTKLAEDLHAGKSKRDGSITAGFANRLADFGAACDHHIQGNVGVVGGTLSHLWHGPKAKRGYFSRQGILARNHFDPTTDTRLGRYGIPVLAGNKPQLIQDLREFGRSRCEDSLDA